MINRRYFLQGLGLLAASQGLAACGGGADALSVLLLRGSLPPQLIRRFRQQDVGREVSFQSASQRKGFYLRLQAWQQGEKDLPWWRSLAWNSEQSGKMAGLVTLGNYWLTEAVKHKLIQPLALESVVGWDRLPPAWQGLVRRDRLGQLTPQGEIWGAPYRWGSTMIAYRRDKLKRLGWQPQDWSDLWRSDITRKISMVDQPREVIGLVLKSLGHSYNSNDLLAIAPLKAQLMALQQQIRYYSSTHYLQPLLLGDVWLAVGWSGDILPLLKNNPELGAVVPRSGTALSSDVWVRPTHRDQAFPDPLRSLIDYCWQPEVAEQISRLTSGSSPVLLSQTPLPSPSGSSQLLRSVDPQIIKRSEFLEPLSPDVTRQYGALWQEIRAIRS